MDPEAAVRAAAQAYLDGGPADPRAAALRAQIKALDVAVAETAAVASRVARDAASFGRIGRRRRGANAPRDAYGGYCDAVDRAIAVAGESFIAGEDTG